MITSTVNFLKDFMQFQLYKVCENPYAGNFNNRKGGYVWFENYYKTSTFLANVNN